MTRPTAGSAAAGSRPRSNAPMRLRANMAKQSALRKRLAAMAATVSRIARHLELFIISASLSYGGSIADECIQIAS